MKLPTQIFHYSKNPIPRIIRRNYLSIRKKFLAHPEGMRYMTNMKPNGLWVSIEDYPEDVTWKSWCEAEEFRLENLQHRYLVKLKENANILHLQHRDEILDFGIKNQSEYNQKYLSRPSPSSDLILKMINETDNDKILKDFKECWGLGEDHISDLDWIPVMKKYDGIFIYPYEWSLRNHNSTAWYHGWDCASGCIWNTRIIDSIEEK